jgi:hypothetical protein
MFIFGALAGVLPHPISKNQNHKKIFYQNFIQKVFTASESCDIMGADK